MRVLVDEKPLTVESRMMTGRQLRESAGVAPGTPLYLSSDFDDADAQVEDGELVRLNDGMRFYSVPRELE